MMAVHRRVEAVSGTRGAVLAAASHVAGLDANARPFAEAWRSPAARSWYSVAGEAELAWTDDAVMSMRAGEKLRQAKRRLLVAEPAPACGVRLFQLDRSLEALPGSGVDDSEGPASSVRCRPPGRPGDCPRGDEADREESRA